MGLKIIVPLPCFLLKCHPHLYYWFYSISWTYPEVLSTELSCFMLAALEKTLNRMERYSSTLWCTAFSLTRNDFNVFDSWLWQLGLVILVMGAKEKKMLYCYTKQEFILRKWELLKKEQLLGMTFHSLIFGVRLMPPSPRFDCKLFLQISFGILNAVNMGCSQLVPSKSSLPSTAFLSILY